MVGNGKVDGRVRRGEQSRRAILDRAMDIASVEGLESLSTRRLSAELGLSNSGVFAQFGSKEELQLATVRAAIDVFATQVVKPARRAPAGMRRVRALAESWIDYAAKPIFSGGCFFLSTISEFDARPGRVRGALAAARQDWLRLYGSTVAEAISLGEIDPDIDPADLAFELDAVARLAAQDALLFNDPARYEQARRMIDARLATVATT
ncbi:TetR/AcrR family transcriptional regulator [Nocardia cyriacigeorgica]|uniref:TetR/AcrR family transcriptional regulator n=1 Tax=Nocardia cyriacigeorgica TaxID=135487 RepID=A0ABX0CHB8_9NOCA|nr:TetR/AcrR family transcriptional regulator [Nocardia cyriacigeorgica]NEW55945.1 TetR/AcrR family transcriptional regulator [Nocardia cyriacigeorgica]